MEPIKLAGGLNLRIDKASVNPGTLQDCLNYEVTDVDGYSRIAGMERFDGQFRLADYRYLRLRGSIVSGRFDAGDTIRLGASTGYVTSLARGSGFALYTVFHDRDAWPVAPVDVQNQSQVGSATITAVDVLPQPVGKQAVVNIARQALTDSLRPLVGLVPGHPDHPVSGTFWFKNRLYAIRDYPLVWFESAKQFPFRIGDQVTMPGGVYTIIDISYTSDAYLAGYMVLWPLGLNGTPMLHSPAPGDMITRPGGYVGFDLGGAAVGELPVAMMGNLSAGDSKAEVTSPGATGTATQGDDLQLVSSRAPAGLWKATSGGWQSVDLKREAQFSSGAAAFGSFIDANIGIGAAPLTSDYMFCGRGVLNGHDVTSKVDADDGTDAALSGGAGDELRVTQFDFSVIPDTATILGIEVRIKRHADDGAKAVDAIVELIGLDGTSSNKARVVAWDTAPTEVAYGGANDTWGNDNITPAVLKSPGFGVRLVTQAVDEHPSGGIDDIKVNVTYRRRDAAVYVRSASNDIPVNLIDVQLITGSWQDGDAAGWLVLDIPSASWASVIANGMELRTAPDGGGDLLATIASGDTPIRLAGWPDLQANQSQYRFVDENYYGQAEYQAIYGVSGATPAFTYDGTRLLWIRTPIDPAQDLPRHIARHGSMLVLGYYSGAYILSQPGNPTNFRGEDGASSIEIGERLTNLLPAIGDALLVTSTNQTKMLQGLTPDEFQQTTVSANRGAIEYTGADVGRMVITDTLGVAAADATDEFGDLKRTYISEDVQAWLAPRLRSSLGPDKRGERPVTSLVVKVKNQYRLYFNDGYVMTMTVKDAPEFTLQRYFMPADDPDMPDQPFPLAASCTGVDMQGRERVFGSFDAQANRGYVFELDHGTSFDGQPIPAHIVLNPLSFGDATMLKRFERFFVLGRADGFAVLRASRRAGYELPDGTGGLGFKFGDPRTDAGVRASRGKADLPVEGYEVSIRIDSSSNSEGVHTLQSVSTDASPRGTSRGHVRG